MVQKVLTAKRNISFFKIKTKNTGSLRDILLYINSLVWDDMYTSKSFDDERVFLRDLKEKDGFVFWVMSWMRMNGIPKKGKMWDKNLTDIWLKFDEWITETTHFLYSPSREILLIEYNHYWPRFWTLEWHLNDRANNNAEWWIDEVELQPILNYEILEKIDDLKEIKSFTFSIPKTHIGNFPKEDNSIFSAFFNSYQFWDTWEITVTLKAEKRSRKPILQNADELKNELEKIWYEIWKNFNEFKVRALSKSENKVKVYDFLQDKFKTEITVVKLWKSREIDEDDIFNKMKDSFNTNKDELHKLTQYE